MDTFQAVAEPTRREILSLLSSGKKSASEISSKFKMSAPAISQHLKVLRESNILQIEKNAQKRFYKINPEARSWVMKVMQLWNTRFENLEEVISGA